MIREVSDKQYGIAQPDGSWTGLVGEVQRGASDQCFWGFLKNVYQCYLILTLNLIFITSTDEIYKH